MSTAPEQLGFAWADAPTDPPPQRARERTRAKSADAAPSSLEAMAQLLQDSGDYRVLRRLRQCLQFPAGQPGATLRRLALVDTETTGLNAELDRIIELAMVVVDVDIDRGVPVGAVCVFDGFEDPQRPLPAQIVALTGITDDMVRGQRLDEAALAQALSGVSWVVAHNAAFDRPFVQARWPAFAALPWACSFADLDWKARGHASAKLQSLAADAGWFYDAHRADADCHALLAVLARADADGQNALAQLWRSVNEPHFRLSALGAPFERKELLKARGYRWDAQQRVWHTLLRSASALADERAWLAEHVYANPRAPIRIEVLEATIRYAAATGQVRVEPLIQAANAGV